MSATTYTLTCLSPVHVGTGTRFGRFDGFYHNGRWRLIALEQVLARGADPNRLARAMDRREFAWDDWLREQGIAPAEVEAYSLPCPEDPGETEVREAIKNVYGQPYLPGSSVKGAIRTAVLWALMRGDQTTSDFLAHFVTLALRGRDLFNAFRDQRAFSEASLHRDLIARTLDVKPEEAGALQQTLYRLAGVQENRLQRSEEWQRLRGCLSNLGKDREWLGQPVERAILGRDPNHDLLRSLQVGDTDPCSLDRLAVGLVWTYTLRNGVLVEKREQGQAYRAFAEWLLPETELRLSLRLDEFLFTDAANRELRFRGVCEQAVRELASTCNTCARARIEAEQGFYRRHGPRELLDACVELQGTLDGLPEGAFLLNIGWGGGWEIKTAGDLVEVALEEEALRALRKRFGLGQKPGTKTIDFSAPFPKTRRLGYQGGAPRWPLGWVRLEPQEAQG